MPMRYLLAGSLGFLLCGVWFGSQLWLTHIFSKRGCHHLIYFSPLFAACIPIVLIIRLNGLYSPQLSALSNGKLWALTAATLLVTCLIKGLSGKKCRTAEKRELAWICMEAAFVEIAQRLMMQSFVMYLLDVWGCATVWCIFLNALIWCAGIITQGILSKQKMGKDIVFDLIASFVFSMGCGYVFYLSGCIVFSAAAHAVERAIMTKPDR